MANSASYLRVYYVIAAVWGTGYSNQPKSNLSFQLAEILVGEIDHKYK